MNLSDPPGNTELSLNVKRNNKISAPLFLAYAVLASIILTLATCALSAVIIRNLDSLYMAVSPEIEPGHASYPSLDRVFTHLETAELDVHTLIPAVFSLAFTITSGLMVRSGKNKRHPKSFIILFSVSAVILFLFSLAFSVAMTDADGVLFSDIITSISNL